MLAIEEEAAVNAVHKIVEHEAFLESPHSWILFSALIFSFIIYKKAKKPLLDSLDARSARIKAELDEAERLKCEAQKLLEEYKEMQNSAKKDAEKIIETAKEYAAALKKKADRSLDEQLKRREALLLERITRAESSAIEEVRYQAADMAANAAQHILEESMAKTDIKLVEDSIKDLPKRFA